MNCIAIWCSRKSHEQDNLPSNSLECHFNLWMLKNVNARRLQKLDCFLDIGIRLSHAEDLSHVNIFIPDELDRSNIQDLGLAFKEKAELVSAVFNEDWGVLARAQEKTIEVQRADKTPLFDIYMLDLERDVVVESQFDGSTIRIRIPEHLKNRDYYYRIRLKCAFVDQIGYIYSRPANSILEGAFFQTALVDFRLNEKRNLPNSLLEIIRQEGEIRFSKTHFFLMREASDDYIFAHKSPRGRQLEKDIWKAYVGEGYLFERITAYHWKDDQQHGNFSVFIKFRSFHCGLRTILIAIGLILLVGCLAGLLGNLLYSLLT